VPSDALAKAHFALIPPAPEHLEIAAREGPRVTVTSAVRATHDGRVVAAESHLLDMRSDFEEYTALRFSVETGSVPLGRLPGLGAHEHEDQTIEAMSPDGTVFVGNSYAQGLLRAYRFDVATGIEEIGEVGGATQTVLNSASSDASVAVGQTVATQMHAWRFDENTGTVLIEPLPGTESSAVHVSPDGSTIVGFLRGPGFATLWFARESLWAVDPPLGFEGCTWSFVVSNGSAFGSCLGGRHFRFDEATGATDVGVLAEYPEASTTLDGVSADGSTVFGHLYDLGNPRGFAAFDGGPPSLLAHPSGDTRGTYPQATTPNGSTIVGVVELQGGARKPCSWRRGLAPLLLELPTGLRDGQAWSVSADGRRIAGLAAPVAGSTEHEALLWDEHGKVRVLEDVLRAEGLDLGGAELRTAVIDETGEIVHGAAIDASGAERGFVARIPR
jgi:uncharacterized membrane protein